MTARPNPRSWLIGSVIAFVAGGVLFPLAGPAPLDYRAILAHREPEWSIFTQLRVSRTLLGLFAGGALSLAGSLFQAMLREALATPYTLGVSTGASLGAVIVIALGGHTFLGAPAIWTGALAGAAAVLLLVVGSAARQERLSAFGLLLTGIATNSVCSAVILLIHGFAGMAQSFSIARWLLGSVDAVAYGALVPFIAITTLVSAWTLSHARNWNLLAVGEDWAAARGTRVPRLMLGGYVAGSLLAASTVALAGPISFVGLIVPHLARNRVGGDHRLLMPCSFLLGGVLLAGCDALGRSLFAPTEVPAGAIMALLGGPYLVWLVRHRG
jgi:iron complex transport system permease protein